MLSELSPAGRILKKSLSRQKQFLYLADEPKKQNPRGMWNPTRIGTGFTGKRQANRQAPVAREVRNRDHACGSSRLALWDNFLELSALGAGALSNKVRAILRAFMDGPPDSQDIRIREPPTEGTTGGTGRPGAATWRLPCLPRVPSLTPADFRKKRRRRHHFGACHRLFSGARWRCTRHDYR